MNNGDEVRRGASQNRALADDFSSEKSMYSATDLMVIAAPFALLFGSLLWVTIFLQTYRHFPKMDPRQRVWMSCKSATTMTVALLAIVCVFLYLIIQQLLGR